MNKLNVVLINPPSIPYSALLEGFTQVPSSRGIVVFSMPLGILHLLSCIERIEETNEIVVLDYALEYRNHSKYASLDDFIDQIASNLDFVPDILGFSLIFSTTHRFFNECANRLKEKWPNVKIVVGGIHVTNCTEAIFENKNVDFVIRGESEVSFPLLLQSLANSMNDEAISIPGVYTKESFSENKTSLKIAPFVDLEKLPLPGWKYINMDTYATLRGRGGAWWQHE